MTPVLRPHLRYFARTLLFYLVLFSGWRAVFILVNVWLGKDKDLSSALPALFHGLRMDLSVSGYLIALMVILWALQQRIRKSGLNLLHRSLHVFFICIATLICMGNVLIYGFWGSMLNYRALTYLTDPQEVAMSLTPLQSIAVLLAFTLTLWAALRLFRRLVPSKLPVSGLRLHTVFLLSVLLLGMSLLAIRGGLQKNPMNESLVYFSPDIDCNSAAVNPIWHLAYDVSGATADTRNPFAFMTAEAADKALAGFRAHRMEEAPHILTSDRPNIVIILLESFTADIVGAMGGDSGVTPFLDSLIAQGLLFDSIYSSGFRTDQGIVSVLNGWPATPFHSIMRSVEKCRKLPSLSKSLDSLNYTTSFYYGGESNFSNMNAFLLEQGFSKLVDQRDFDDDVPRGQWGVYDREVLLRQSAELDGEQQPFLSVLMTLSNHEPFDVPGPPVFEGDSAPARFRNAAHYTDESLRTFFADASKKSWYRNTLFILAADHAHELPRGRYVLYPEGRHIPLLFYGPVLSDAVTGTRCGTIGGHHDIAATLLPQLGIPADAFKWSKNLLAPSSLSFAYLPYENYLTWIGRDGWFLRSLEADTVVAKSKGLEIRKGDERDILSRAFMQEHYSDYLEF
jgi:phosphoglycerol transferase MdoB-like AlkP superfamily enzyme